MHEATHHAVIIPRQVLPGYTTVMKKQPDHSAMQTIQNVYAHANRVLSAQSTWRQINFPAAPYSTMQPVQCMMRHAVRHYINSYTCLPAMPSSNNQSRQLHSNKRGMQHAWMQRSLRSNPSLYIRRQCGQLEMCHAMRCIQQRNRNTAEAIYLTRLCERTWVKQQPVNTFPIRCRPFSIGSFDYTCH